MYLLYWREEKAKWIKKRTQKESEREPRGKQRKLFIECKWNAGKKQDGGGMLSPGVEQGLTVSLAGGQASWAARVQPFSKFLKGT